MQPPYHGAGGVRREAYVDVRVCELFVQRGSTPAGLDGEFQVDGLYVVLRCGEETRRTSCLWSPGTSAAQAANRSDPAPAGAFSGDAVLYDGDSEGDFLWNEIFRFTIPPESSSATAAEGAPSTPEPAAQGGYPISYTSSSTSSLPFPYPPFQQTSGNLTGTGSAAPAPGNGSLFSYPAIELELWRSTPLSENLLGKYTYYVPMELMQNGFDLAHLDAVAERVVQLRTKETPSIMGSLYGWSGHRLSLGLRVQAIGLAPIAPTWMSSLPPPHSRRMSTTAPLTGMTNSLYPPPFPHASLSGTVGGLPSHAVDGRYGAPIGSPHPVLGTFSAPFSVYTARDSTMASTVGFGGMRGPGIVSSGNATELHTSSFAPTYFSAPYGAVGGSFGRPASQGVSGLPSTAAMNAGQGILGDGNLTWPPPSSPSPLGPPFNLPHSQQRQRQ